MSTDSKHSIDKLFHESLEGHKIEPGSAVWQSLSRHVPTGSSTNYGSYLATAAAVVLISLLLNFGMYNLFHKAGPAVQKSETTAIPELGITATPAPADKQAVRAQDIPFDADVQAADAEPAEPAIQQAPPPAINIAQTVPVLIENTPMAQGDNPLRTAAYHKLDRNFRTQLNAADGSVKLHSSSMPVQQAPVFNMGLEDAYFKKSELLIGAGFSPAVNIYPDGQNRNDFSFELIAVYERSRFFAEAGIGANYATESVKYGLTYTSYDSVGYFVNVHSFSIDPQNPDSIRLQTSLKNIYDSIDYFRVEENTNKYAYLQVPVRIGYRIIEKKSFSLDLKAGIIFSWQIVKDVPEIPYQGSDAEQIEVIRQYPDRLKVNWQYTAALGLNYHINSNCRFTLEPFYRQYLKSVYSSDSEYAARSPFAVGLRAGIYVKF